MNRIVFKARLKRYSTKDVSQSNQGNNECQGNNEFQGNNECQGNTFSFERKVTKLGCQQTRTILVSSVPYVHGELTRTRI